MAGWWLPDDCQLDLTALELGALAAILARAKSEGIADFAICKPGPNNEAIATTMIARLTEKVEHCISRKYLEGRNVQR
jgi:hypothetical protein